MPADKLNWVWLSVTIALILIIISSSLIIWARRDKGQPLVIADQPASSLSGQIVIDGAVTNPGTYPLKSGDSLDELLQASGGIAEDADLSRIHLYVPPNVTTSPAQKIDINRADIWLLEALPGIGEVRARAIIDYRQRNGPFGTIEDLTKVPGLSSSVFEQIRELITVGEP